MYVSHSSSPFTIPEIRTRVSVGITAGRNNRTHNGNQNHNHNGNNNNNETNFNDQPSNIPFASLGQLVNGIISGFMGQASAQSGQSGRAAPSAPTATPTPNSTPNEPSVSVDPTLIDLMGRLNNERPGQENTETSESNETNMTDMFMSFVNGILGIISGGQSNNTNVAHFLTQLDGFSYVEGENIANDIFMVMGRHLSFQDLFQIFAGNPEPLSRVRQPLKEFVERSILNGNVPNSANIENAINSIVQSWRPGLEMMTVSILLSNLFHSVLP